MSDRDEILNSMYSQDEEDENIKRPQPEQLRLAGKATLIPHDGKHLAIPRIDYVESLEAQIRDLKFQNEDLFARLRRLEAKVTNSNNIVNRRMSALDSIKTNTNHWTG